MKDINDLPLETQFVLERFNRVYRQLNMLFQRKPTIEELSADMELNLTDMEYYLEIAREYLGTIDVLIEKEQESANKLINIIIDDSMEDIFGPNPIEEFFIHVNNNTYGLTKRELKYLKLFWGFLDGHAKTYQQMSLILEIKTKKIKQMLKDATRKIVTE